MLYNSRERLWHWRHLLALLVLVLGLDAEGAQERPVFAAYQRPVTIWVPPYAVSNSFLRLKELRDGAGAQHSITHLALQFWKPAREGGVQLVGNRQVNPTSIASLRTWAHQHGIRVMLCVYNAANGSWDWELARSAFIGNRTNFISHLDKEMIRWNLDGIDVDLEGNGSLDGDKGEFVAFISELSKVLRKQNKHLTVDTFAYKWHAPNQTWWADLFPHVDAITSMGYEEIGAGAAEWRAYDAQRLAAGQHASKLQIGMPSHRDRWQNDTVTDHLKWIEANGEVGVAIWDAQLRSDGWRQPDVWKAVARIRDGPSSRLKKAAP